jgi:hypothetical protein|nr:MAG TPA: hypothetical protein [Caudoviricetes sp.]
MNKGYKPKDIRVIKALENNRRSLLDLIEEKRSQLTYLSRDAVGYRSPMSHPTHPDDIVNYCKEYFDYYIPVELLCFNYTLLYKFIDRAIRSNHVEYFKL